MESEADLMTPPAQFDRWSTIVAAATVAVSAACQSRLPQPAEALSGEQAPDAKAPPVGSVVVDVRRPSEDASRQPDEPRTVRFAWRPPGADKAPYTMAEPEDQHRIVIVGHRETGSYPVVVALHGQPKRGQSPRSYAFARRVIDATTEVVMRGDVPPLVVALPVFRFSGLNWPSFDLVAFRAKVEEVMAAEGLIAGDFYVVGHSGAAGCGGDGMNRAHRLHPAAVGFFDTCLGAGWGDEIRALERDRVPTSILQSVETAGVQPRQLREYDGRYDFGPIFRTVGLAPVACPAHVPAAPLRPQPYRCSATGDGLVRGFIVDTGQGEEAHNALVGVALAYFLREHLPR
jgi:hypothetical protein